MFEELYEYLLAAIFKKKFQQQGKKLSEIDQIQYLRSLQQYVKDLRTGYNNASVKIDYSEIDVQAAYLIAYAPQYAELTLRCLEIAKNDIKDIFNSRSEISVCLFGAGPCPELIALFEYCTKHFRNIRGINLYAFDINADSWKFSTDIMCSIITQKWRQISLRFSSIKFNLCDASSLDLDKELILRQSNILIFQNCINELGDQSLALDNIKSLLNCLNPSASCLIIDLAKSSRVRRMFFSISRDLDPDRLRIMQFISEQRLISQLSQKIPEIIQQYLLTGSDRLIPRRKIDFSLLEVSSIQAELKVPDPATNSLIQQLEELRSLYIKIGDIQQSFQKEFSQLDEFTKNELKDLNKLCALTKNELEESKKYIDSEIAKIRQLTVSLSQKLDEQDNSTSSFIEHSSSIENKEEPGSRLASEIYQLKKKHRELTIWFCAGFLIALLLAIFI